MARVIMSKVKSIAANTTDQIMITESDTNWSMRAVSAGFNVNDGGGVLIPLLLQPEMDGFGMGSFIGWSLTVKNTDSVARDAELYVVFE